MILPFVTVNLFCALEREKYQRRVKERFVVSFLAPSGLGPWVFGLCFPLIGWRLDKKAVDPMRNENWKITNGKYAFGS